MVVKTLVTMLVVGLAAALPVSAPDDSVEDVIDGEMDASGAPGLAYAVEAWSSSAVRRRSPRTLRS